MMKKIIAAFLMLMIVMSMCACGSDEQYLTSFSKVLTDDYYFAVDVKNYSGDVYESGTYKFSFTLQDEENIPHYVLMYSDDFYDDYTELQEAISAGKGDILAILCSPAYTLDAFEDMEYTLEGGKYYYIAVSSFGNDAALTGTTLHMELKK